MALNIQENFSLKAYHTFGIDVTCRYFIEITEILTLYELLSHEKWRAELKLILGEGSNILFRENFAGLVIKISLKGIKLIKEDEKHIWLNVAAGENWHQFVLFCIENNYAGVENLSLIPGSVGAAPMQNIGAYGVELCQVFESLSAMRISDGSLCTFDKNQCEFGYRESVFKKACKDQYIITSVNFRLNKTPEFKLSYGAIRETLLDMQVNPITLRAVSDAVIQIRQQKLPDPKLIGNAGSFFLSPVLSKNKFLELFKQYPNLPFFTNQNEHYKIPAGWLIEQCGFKGKRFGKAGVHDHHALVLVNHGESTGQEIKALAEQIQMAVRNKFSIDLIPEVNIF